MCVIIYFKPIFCSKFRCYIKTVNADTNNTNKQVIFKHVALFSDFDLFTEGN